ncbi:MAG TPA: ABC transporter, partial [Burkholderiaceae bacterium]|nr:ABC transporter [Burkholderiaceae bacterium]
MSSNTPVELQHAHAPKTALGVDPLPVGKLRPLASLLPFLKPYKQQIALALLFLLLAAAATLALPAAIKSVVDNGFAVAVSDPAARLAAVRSQFLLFIPLGLAIAVFTAARYFMMSWLGERVTADLRSAVY